METVIEEIVEKSARNLRCVWTSIPYLEMDASLFNWKEMIACNHYQIHLHPPIIESSVGDWYV